MTKTIIKNIGQFVTGDINQPLLKADCIVIEGSQITYVGLESNLGTVNEALEIDACGLTALPGLIDSHIHPFVGEYSPMQGILGFITNYLHGGTTSMISNGEVLIPGQPHDPTGVKALAILAAKSYQNFRPSGVKVLGGTMLLEKGLSEEDFAEVSSQGVKLAKFLYNIDVNDALRYVNWAHKYKMIVLMHCGGTSVPGGLSTDVEQVLKIRPDILAHLNGGPTAIPMEDIDRLIHETESMMEIVLCGNPKSAVAIAQKALQEGLLERVMLGTDTPTGSGVISLGMWQLIILLTCFAGLKPEQTLCLATGNTGNYHGLGTGLLREGYAADIILLDAPVGSAANDGLSSIAMGDIPAIELIMIDGQIAVRKARNTSPAKREIKIKEIP